MVIDKSFVILYNLKCQKETQVIERRKAMMYVVYHISGFEFARFGSLEDAIEYTNTAGRECEDKSWTCDASDFEIRLEK